MKIVRELKTISTLNFKLTSQQHEIMVPPCIILKLHSNIIARKTKLIPGDLTLKPK